MTYPKHLYRADGPYRMKGFAYSVAGCADELQEAELIDAGWYLSIDAAKKTGGEVIQAADAMEEAHDAITPATRDELEQKAKSMGSRGVHLMKDATLARKIAELV